MKEWKIWNLFYPRKCPICDSVLDKYDHELCEKCERSVSIICGNVCMTCGRPLQFGISLCKDCERTRHSFEWGAALYRYLDIQEAVYRMKYAKREDLFLYFGKEIVRCRLEEINQMHADCIIPIPMHKKRKRKRSYNHAEKLAAQISLHTGIPIYSNAVKRIKKTVPLKYLSRNERQLNLKKAFILGANDVKLKIIILVDDIYTTGTTLDEVSKVLMNAGAKKVFFITLAIGSE